MPASLYFVSRQRPSCSKPKEQIKELGTEGSECTSLKINIQTNKNSQDLKLYIVQWKVYNVKVRKLVSWPQLKMRSLNWMWNDISKSESTQGQQGLKMSFLSKIIPTLTFSPTPLQTRKECTSQVLGCHLKKLQSSKPQKDQGSHVLLLTPIPLDFCLPQASGLISYHLSKVPDWS